MNDFQRDAYVGTLPDGWPDGSTHSVIIDILTDDSNEPVIHQIVCNVFGKNNAKTVAIALNHWRDQMRHIQ